MALNWRCPTTAVNWRLPDHGCKLAVRCVIVLGTVKLRSLAAVGLSVFAAAVSAQLLALCVRSAWAVGAFGMAAAVAQELSLDLKVFLVKHTGCTPE